MSDRLKYYNKLSTEQEAIKAKCFHHTGDFTAFREEELERSIASRFEMIVSKYPNRMAVKSSNRSLTYMALNEEANRIAMAILADQGQSLEPVAVYLDHDCD